MKTIQLNSGYVIPTLGLGTWLLTEGEIAYNAVSFALKAGYRHIDTARFYKNEVSVGKAIRESNTPREEIFVTTKVWNDMRGYEKTIESVEASLQDMQLDYVDLVLIHWPNPVSLREKGADAWKIWNAETWRALESLVSQGKIRSIGVSNFMVHHLEELLKTAVIKPAVNQIQLAPGSVQQTVVDFCQANDIVVEAYSPFGTGKLFRNEKILEIAQRYNTTPAHLVLQWIADKGVIPIPKSESEKNILSNLSGEAFELSEEDIETLDTLEGIVNEIIPDEIDC